MRRIFHLLLLSALLFLSSVFTPAVYAADATQLAEQISQIAGLTATVDDSGAVTITGSVHSARTTLALNIDAGVTVRWDALYMGSAQPLLSVGGGGTLEVGIGGWVYNTGSGNVVVATDSVRITVMGSSATAAGVVQATTGSAIHCTGLNKVLVEGYGSVLSDVVSNIKPVINMVNEADDSENVVIEDHASVWATADGATNSGYCIQTYGNVRVDGGDIHSASGRGRGINLSGKKSTATVNGGRVWVDGGATGAAISTANTLGAEAVDSTHIIVNGGSVEAVGGGMAIRTVGTHSRVEVNGGVVSAGTGYVISNETNGDNSIVVSGGLVIGYGRGITDASPNTDNIFYTNGGTRVSVSDDGLAAAWDQAHEIYAEGDGNDLLMAPPGATITWHNDPATGGGISYANGANTGFFALPPRVVSDFGLIFDAASGNMYRNLNGDLVFDANEQQASNEYTEGKAQSWDGAPGTLTLKGFYWPTRSQAGLMVVGDAVLRLEGDSRIFAYFREGAGAPRPAYYGVYSESANLAVEGSGSLMALGATEYLYQNPDPNYGARLYCGIGTGGNITLNSGSLMGFGFSEYNGATSIGIRAANVDMVGGMLTMGGFAQAYENTTAVHLPAAYGYWTTKDFMDYSTTGIGALTPFAGADPYNTPYIYTADDELVRISADAFAVIADGTVSGIIELPMTEQTVGVMLYGDVVAGAGLSGVDVTPWFTGLPVGIAVKADAPAGGRTMLLTFTGAPAEARTAALNITIPASVLAGGKSVQVLSNPNAKIAIADRAVLSLTLSDQTVIYTGEQVYAVQAVMTGPNIVAIPALPSYMYEGSGTTVYPATSTVPTNAGTYTVTVTVAEDNNYFGGAATATLTVEEAQPVIRLRFVVTNYTDSPVPIGTPELEGSTKVEELRAGLDYLYESTDNKGYSSDQAPDAAGHYRVTVSTDGNANHYPASATTTIIIGAMSISNVNHADSSKVYDGTPLVADAVTPPGGYAGTVTYSYAGTLAGGSNYPATDASTDPVANAPTEAGSYTVTIALAGDSNYDDIAVSSNLTITKAPATVTINGKMAPYTGAPIAVDEPTCNEDEDAVLTVTYRSADGTSYPETTAAPSGSGVYEVKAVYAGSNNYLPAQAMALLIIVQSKTPTLALADRTVTYDGLPHDIGTVAIQEPEAQSFDVTYTYSNADYPASTTPPTRAGIYTVKATTDPTAFSALNPDNYFAAGEAVAALTIERAPQTITFDLPDKHFGDAHFNVDAALMNTPAVALPLAYQSGDTTISAIDTAGLITIHGAGTATITVSQAGNWNYAPVSVTKTLTVNKSALTLTLSPQTLTYTGHAIHLPPAVLTGGIGEAAFAVAYTYETVGTSVSEAVDAGTYTVTAIATGDADHTGDTATAMLTVAKATPLISLTAVSTLYTGSPVPVHTPVVTGSATAGTLPLTILYEGTNGTTYPASATPPVNAGNYTVTVSTAGDGNHHPATATTTLAIGADNPYMSLHDARKVYDAQPWEAEAVVVPNTLALTYSYAGEGSTAYGPTATPPVNAGQYTVTADYDGSNTNYAAASVTARLEITPKAAVIEITNKTAKYTGSPTGVEATLIEPTVGTLTVAYKGINGTLYAENTTPPTETGEYEVTVEYTGGDNNYRHTSAAARLTITQSEHGLTLAHKTVVYNGSPQGYDTTDVVITPPAAAELDVIYIYSNAVYPASTTPPTDAGVYRVRATTPANAHYAAAEVTAALTIEKAPQSITLDLAESLDADSEPFQVNAALVNTPPADLPLAYQSGNTDIATVSASGLITLLQPGMVTITVSQAGNGNYLPASVTKTLVVTSNNAGLLSITVNGEELEVADDMQYVLPCGSVDNAATVTLTVPVGATVTHAVEGDATVYPPGAAFAVPLDRPQLKTVVITVTSQDGTSAHTYNLHLERRFPFDQLVLMRWDNTLTVINNPANNGGYTFTSYEWYRNGTAFAEGQSWSAGSGGEALSETDLYAVAVTSAQFEGTLRTCESRVTLRREMNVRAYPNPVAAGATLRVRAEASGEAALEGAVIEVYNAMGSLIDRIEAQGSDTELSPNYPAGIYLLVWKGRDGFRKVMKVSVSN